MKAIPIHILEEIPVVKYLAALALLAASPAAAEDVTVMGIGYMQCFGLTQMYEKANTNVGIQMMDGMVASWSSGFMSATNMMIQLTKGETKNLGSMPREQQIIFIRKYCKKNVGKQVLDGVMELYQGLASNDGE
jgi:hypothetical protein